MKNDGFVCSLKFDLFKLKKHKSVWIGLALVFGLTLLLYCIYWVGLEVIGAQQYPVGSDEAALQQQMLLALSQLGVTLVASFSDTCALSLFVAIIVCLYVGKDFSNGVIKLSISRGANRTQLYFSKWLSVALLVTAYTAFSILICGIFAAFKGLPDKFTALHFGYLVRNFFLQLLANVSTASIVLAIAFLCRSSGASLGATIGASIALSIIFSLVTSVGGLSGSSLDWVQFMPLQQSAGLMTKYTATQLCANIIMPVVYGGAATAIGLASFLKRDVK